MLSPTIKKLPSTELVNVSIRASNDMLKSTDELESSANTVRVLPTQTHMAPLAIRPTLQDGVVEIWKKIRYVIKDNKGTKNDTKMH